MTDEDALSELHAMKRELNGVRSGLVELQKTCESAFKHTFSATKRKSPSRKQNSNKSKKRKKVRRLARMDEVLRKIAPELPEGKTCTKKDLRTEIVIQLGTRQEIMGRGVDIFSSICSLFDNTSKSELRRVLSFAGTESSDDANYDDESDDEASDAAAGDGNGSDGVGSDNDAGDGVESDGDEGDDDGWRCQIALKVMAMKVMVTKFVVSKVINCHLYFSLLLLYCEILKVS